MDDTKMDFSAIATAYGVKCSDGLTIAKGSFSHQDGAKIPMVYQHNHYDINNVIGHCILKDEDGGMRLYGYLNPNVDAGQKAKFLIQHGDITAVSIFAKDLKKNSSGNIVTHGNIKEVSIVLAGANPGAIIDYVTLEHSDGSLEFVEEEGIIYNGNNIDQVYNLESLEKENTVEHAYIVKNNKIIDEIKDNIMPTKDEEPNKIKDNATSPKNKKSNKDIELIDEYLNKIKDVELTDEENELLNMMVDKLVDNKPSENDRKEIENKFNKLPKDKQIYFLSVIGLYSEDKNNKKNKDNKGGEDMGTISQSIFNNNENTLSQDDVKDIFATANKCGSLKESILEHAATYGIDGIENLFPDYKDVGEPSTIKRDQTFVPAVLDNVRKVPFSKIRSKAFNITASEARARGYVKGDRKVEEVIVALKRETTPQTIYKKQKIDRDDLVDITDFDTVAYLKKELQEMLKEELARAILIGDGRLPDAEGKIKENNIRPISSDDNVFSIKVPVTFSENAKNSDIADEIIEKMLKARKNYKGSGNPTFFCSPDYLTTMLLAKDTIGRKLYATQKELADALRVSDIVEVEQFEGATYVDSRTSKVYDIVGIAVNLKDYTIGNNDLGKTAMFDDFDINYNQLIYLIETRCSGALTVPYSALVLIKEQTNSAG